MNDGIVFFSSWNSWTTTLIDSETQDKIYREYVIFVENCYKNSEWNSNSTIRGLELSSILEEQLQIGWVLASTLKLLLGK